MTPRRDASAEDEARAVWEAHYAALAGYCTGVLADRHRGQDIAAEAFARLWARWGRVDDPRGFLFVVATNLCPDLPVAEIARRLRRPEGTVKRLLSEARALLRTAAEETP